VHSSNLGAVIAGIAAITTASYQTMIATYQQTHQVSAIQLSHRVALPQFLMCFFCAILMETGGYHNIFQQEYPLSQVLLIGLTGLFAVLGVIVSFALIGATDSVTFQVIGHLRSVLLFAFSLFLFPEYYEGKRARVKKCLGFAVSMLGVILYSFFEVRIKATEKREAAARNSAVDA
jgi:solute carrier family 35 protein E3